MPQGDTLSGVTGERSARFDLFLHHLRVERNLSKHTVDNYALDLREYLGELEEADGKFPADLTAENVQRHLAHLRAAGLSARSIARHLSAIRSFHRFVVDEGLLDEEPAAEVSAPKQPHKLPQWLSLEEVDALLAQIDESTSKGLRDRAMVELMYAAGLRVSELCGLRLGDLELDPGLVRGSSARVPRKGSYRWERWP